MVGNERAVARSRTGCGFVVVSALALLLVSCGGTVESGQTGGSGAASGGGSAGGNSMGGQGGAGAACDDVSCTAQDCLPGEVEVQREGECCPLCEAPVCPAIPCPRPRCGPGTEVVTRPGECCPTCEPVACDGVPCADIDCTDEAMLIVPPGECCPVCEPIDCALVRCADPACADGFMPTTPPGECCPVCVPSSDTACWDAQDGVLAAAFDAFGQDLVACTTTGDCAVLDLATRCGISCGTAVSVKLTEDLLAFAASYGERTCARCPLVDVACPPVLHVVGCDLSGPTGVCRVE